MLFLKRSVLFVLAVVLFLSAVASIISLVVVRSILDPGFYMQVARQEGVYDLIRQGVVHAFEGQVANIDDIGLRKGLLQAVSGALRESWMDRELKEILTRVKEYLETGTSTRFTIGLTEFKAALKEEVGKILPEILPHLDLDGIPASLDVTAYMTGPDGVLSQLAEPYHVLKRVPSLSVVATGAICLLMLLICLFRPDGFRWVSMPLILAGMVMLLVALVAGYGAEYTRPVLVRILPPEMHHETGPIQVLLGAVSALGRRMALWSGILLATTIPVWIGAGMAARRRRGRET